MKRPQAARSAIGQTTWASSRPKAGRPKRICQTACKPGSVPPEGGDDHSSGPPIAERFSRPTRTPRAVNPAGEPARRPYSVLLQAGLAMPPTLPPTRWALTPPFHPCRSRRPGGLLSVALSLGSPRAEVIRRLFTVEPGLSSTGAKARRDRPAVWRGVDAPARSAGQPSPRSARADLKNAGDRLDLRQLQQAHEAGARVAVGHAVDTDGPPVPLKGAHGHLGFGVVVAARRQAVAQPVQA